MAEGTEAALAYLSARPLEAVVAHNSALVHNTREADTLFGLGFGKGILSRSKPVFFRKAETATTRTTSSTSSVGFSTASDFHRQKRARTEDQLAPEGSREEPSSLAQLEEPLQLSAEEAVYLTLRGALRPLKEGKALSLEELWLEYGGSSSLSFVSSFAVYLHYKRRGWFPKCGLKFGVDLVLYSGSVERFHSRFGALVRYQFLHEAAQPAGLDWTAASSALRVLSQSSKELLCVTATLPSKDPTFYSKLESINQITIHEVLVSRFKT